MSCLCVADELQIVLDARLNSKLVRHTQQHHLKLAKRFNALINDPLAFFTHDKKSGSSDCCDPRRASCGVKVAWALPTSCKMYSMHFSGCPPVTLILVFLAFRACLYSWSEAASASTCVPHLWRTSQHCGPPPGASSIGAMAK